MRQHLSNAIYGVLDYAAYPMAMLLVAPIVLRRLGASGYGLWIVSSSIISAGGILASCFCDAAMQRIARLRGENQLDAVVRTIRSLLTINLALASLIAISVWLSSPIAAYHLATSRVASFNECLYSIRLSGACILLRALDSVAVITHRAFEQYGPTVQISVGARLFTLMCAAILATRGFRVFAILIATGIGLTLGAVLQYRRLRDHLPTVRLWPLYERREFTLLLRPGVFVGIQSACGVVFGQLDRILLGLSFGAAALAPYALCVQFAQPILGLSASSLHFLFPLISRRTKTLDRIALQQLLTKSMACNLLIVAVPATALLLLGAPVIRMWSGGVVSRNALTILSPVVLSCVFMGLGVSGTYAMQALGRFRTVALLNIGGRMFALILLVCLLPHLGLQGVLIARMCFGATALLVYIPLAKYFWEPKSGCIDRVGTVQLQEEEA